MIVKNPEFFRKDKYKDIYLRETCVKRVCSKLMDLFPKPLTRDEIIIIIEGLESRKDSILEYRNTRGYKSDPCTLSDISISTIGGIITEDTAIKKKSFNLFTGKIH